MKKYRTWGLILALGGTIAAVIGIALPGPIMGMAANGMALPLVVAGSCFALSGLLMLAGLGSRQAEYIEILEELRQQKRSKRP